MRKAEFVVALSAFRHAARDYAHVMLPIAPFTETAGTFVSTEGRVQSFHPRCGRGRCAPGVESPARARRPARLPGFEYDSIERVREDCLRGKDVAALLSNKTVPPARPIISSPGSSASPMCRSTLPMRWCGARRRCRRPATRARRAAG
jgi:NADH-quinone oxidoreductase subunit G